MDDSSASRVGQWRPKRTGLIMCHNLFDGAKGKLDCPIKVFPKCHKRAHVEVHVDAKRRRIILSCSHCEQPISTIEVKREITTS